MGASQPCTLSRPSGSAFSRIHHLLKTELALPLMSMMAVACVLLERTCLQRPRGEGLNAKPARGSAERRGAFGVGSIYGPAGGLCWATGSAPLEILERMVEDCAGAHRTS